MTVRYDRLKSQLLADKEQLQARMKDTTTVAGASVGYGNHMADDAGYAYEQATSLSLQQNLKELLFHVNKALERFDHGTYGVCVRCGQSIDPARLKAIPYTPLCLGCAQAKSH